MSDMINHLDTFAQAVRLLGETADTNTASTNTDIIEAYRHAFKAAWECLIYKMHYAVLDDLGDACSTIYAAYVDALIADESGWRDMFFDSDVAIRSLNREKTHILAARVRDRYYPLLAAFEQTLRGRLDT